jgi:hypothetical protein
LQFQKGIYQRTTGSHLRLSFVAGWHKEIEDLRLLQALCFSLSLLDNYVRNTMEHRLNERAKVNVGSTIYQHGLVVGFGIIRDLSTQGCYIETDFLNVGIFQSLDLEVISDYSGVYERCVYHTVVVRHTGTGLGMELASMNTNF